MEPTTAKNLMLTLILASAVPLAACGRDTPTSPTQPGPPVSEAPPPTITQEPPSVDPAPTDNRPIVSITGVVVNLVRSGSAGADVSFRIDDFTIVRVAGNTPVTRGSFTFTTAAILSGQTVTVEGRRTDGFLDATSVSIISPAP
jgi:ABC-type oligopeptide transport system substrate-binding subunit